MFLSDSIIKILIAIILFFVFTPIGAKLYHQLFMSKQEKMYRKNDKKIMRKVKNAKAKRLKRVRKAKLPIQESHKNMTQEEYIQACSDELKL